MNLYEKIIKNKSIKKITLEFDFNDFTNDRS